MLHDFSIRLENNIWRCRHCSMDVKYSRGDLYLSSNDATFDYGDFETDEGVFQTKARASTLQKKFRWTGPAGHPEIEGCKGATDPIMYGVKKTRSKKLKISKVGILGIPTIPGNNDPNTKKFDLLVGGVVAATYRKTSEGRFSVTIWHARVPVGKMAWMKRVRDSVEVSEIRYERVPASKKERKK